MPSLSRPIEPIRAARALAALVREPQDTRQVFSIINALRGRSTLRRMERFRATETGRRLLAAPRSLLDHLNDRSRLAGLPPGTLGRSYHDFLAEEALSAEGLAALSVNEGDERMTAEERRFFHRMRDAHDLVHVITGYGREPLGEICNLAFTFGQQGGRGIAVIAALGMVKTARDHPGVGVVPAVHEAYRRGRVAGPVVGAEWEVLLDRPVSAVRQQFGIGAAPRYEAAMRAPSLGVAASSP